MIMIKPTHETSALQRYLRLLIQLHFLMTAEKEDDQEADDLRDLMDSFWYKLNEQEVRLARQLSADLYLLNPAEKLPFPRDETYSLELAGTLADAKARKDYLGALEILRKNASKIGAYRALNLISVCYFHLEIHEVSLLFAERAIEFASDYSHARFRLMMAMVRTGKREAALQIARDMLSNCETLDLDQRLFCATLLLGEAQSHEDNVRTDLLKESMTEFETILKELKAHDKDSNNVRVDCLYFLGEGAFLLSNRNGAIEYLSQAIATDPNDEKSLLLRGMLTLAIDSASAINDFSFAIEVGTRAIQAYYYVAYNALVSEDYERCIEVANQGLKQSGDEENLAEIHEMIALSLIGKSRTFERLPVDAIRKHFRMAMQLSPFDIKYKQRLQDFEELVGQHKLPHWSAAKPLGIADVLAGNRIENYLQVVPL